MLRKTVITILFFVIAATAVKPYNSCQAEELAAEFGALSIDELMDVEVTTVSKKKQKLFDTAAAIYVITNEDIRRSGVTSVPEALRLAPGLEVARLDSNKWAVSSRGFNGRFANKLLVLIDGRSVYTPLFAGTFWEEKDMLLDDIERIEVVRGPGGALWGANAVNGIINIITKTTEDTQGVLVNVGAGSEEKAFGSFRYGGKLGNNVSYRVFAKFFKRDSFAETSGGDADDKWEDLTGGFRVDWNADSNSVMFSGGIYNADTGETQTISSLQPPFGKTVEIDRDLTGGHLLGKWTHLFSDTSDMSLQVYYDRTIRDSEVVGEIRDTFDIDFQRRFELGMRHDIIWGLGYRFTADNIDDRFTLSFDPESRRDHLVSAFAQDEIMLIKDQLNLTLGAKLEHNDYTGLEFQPNARIIWTPSDKHTLWSAVSRAVRTPSRIEDDGRINSQVFPNPFVLDGPPILGALSGDHDAESETILAYELGYRIRPTDRIFLDFSGFYNIYNNLRTLEQGGLINENSPRPSHLLIPLNVNNKMDGETYGIEMSAEIQVSDWLKLKGTYTYLEMQLHLDGDSIDTLSEGKEGDIPENQFSLWSFIDLPWEMELDTGFRYVDNLSNLGVDSYISLDVRFGWKPTKNLELSIVGQNLLDSEHLEFTSSFFDVQDTEIERGVYGSIKWEF